jgi:hypothetical protein
MDLKEMLKWHFKSILLIAPFLNTYDCALGLRFEGFLPCVLAV